MSIRVVVAAVCVPLLVLHALPAAAQRMYRYKDENGVRRISFETIRNLYQHQQLPPKEELMARKPTGVLEHLDTIAKMTRG